MSVRYHGFIAALVLATGCAAMSPANGDGTADDSTAASPAAITCTFPVRAGDSAATLIARFGKDAKIETLFGSEGIELPGVVLWEGDPERRVEVLFDDEARTSLLSAEVSAGSRWKVAGLGVGDKLARLRQFNGKPLRFFGFEWDYGGTVIDLGGGALEDLDGCRAYFTLGYDAHGGPLPDALLGDTEVSSDDPEVNAEAISVNTMGVTFQP